MTGEREGLAWQSFPLILAAPSGAGKTTIARELAARRGDIEFSISCTTRRPRANELDGRDYHFLSADQFRDQVRAGNLLEWAEVHGHFYGTPRSNLVEARSRGHLLLLDIDIQGSRQIKARVPEAVTIFILPPSGQELVRRLAGRGSESEEARRRRLMTAREELAAAVEFDYVIVNEFLSEAVDTVERIIVTESTRTGRQAGLASYLESLVGSIDKMLLDGPTD